MQITVEVPVDNSSREIIWSIISDIDHAVEVASSIEKIEVLERPLNEDSLVGLKWEETRIMSGQKATETMWITESVENEYYKTRAESHGCVYISRMYIREEEQSDSKQLYVGLSFGREAQSCCAKIMMFLMGWMATGETRRCLLQELQDIKAAVEKKKKSS